MSPGSIRLESDPFQAYHDHTASVRGSLNELEKKCPRTWVILLIFTLSLQMLVIWNGELSNPDSPRVAGIAREMAVTSNYLIPRLNGKNFLEYPSLGYLPIALTFAMSEKPPDFLAFLPIVLLGMGTVFITFLTGKRLAGERIGLASGFILSTMLGFVTLHRHCRVDPALLLFVTLSLYGFVTGYHLPEKRFRFFAVFYLAMAGAFLSKGIIGAAIPVGTALIFLTARRDFRTVRKLFVGPVILFFLVPVLLWVGSVWWFEGFGIFEEVIRQSLHRFSSPAADHAQPLYYYFIPAFSNLMPWTLLPLVLLWPRSERDDSGEALSRTLLLKFSLVWCVTVFIGLFLASAKRLIYLGPILPPFAILTALGLDRLREKFPGVRRWELSSLMIIFFLYIGTYQLSIIPSERKDSLRPVFEAVSSQQASGPVYLVHPSEALLGASFFYLGKRTPTLNEKDFLLGRFANQPGTTFVIYSYWDDDQLPSNLRSKGYRLIFRKKYGKATGVCVYSNSS